MIDQTPDGIVVDEANRVVQITRSYPASIERVWSAWTEADAISRWWGPHGWVTTVHEMDVRPGGRWRFTLAPADGSADPVRAIARYQQVVWQRALVYSDAFADTDWRPEGPVGFHTEVSFTAAEAGSSTVRVAVDFPDLEALRRAVELQMADGYAEALERLDSVLAELRRHQTCDHETSDHETSDHVPNDHEPSKHEPSKHEPQGGSTMSELETVSSADGTMIAYETTGTGPTVIVINTVAEDHTGVAGIAAELAKDFTVITYDRRGRGRSGDPQPYDPAREIDDIAALVDVGGGTAALVSGSGGCVLALDAASVLGAAITGLYLYEPPLIVSDIRPPVPADYVEHQETLVAAGKRREAVEYFMSEVIQVPAEFIEMMKQDPSWDEMAKLAHTYAYDGRICSGVQQGRPLPTDRWSVRAPIRVVVGEHGEPFMREGAEALATTLDTVTVETLAGQDHSAFWVAPEPVADSVRAFLAR